MLCYRLITLLIPGKEAKFENCHMRFVHLEAKQALMEKR